MKKGNILIVLGVLLILGALAFTAHNIYKDRTATEAADEAVEALSAQIFGNEAQSTEENTEEAGRNTAEEGQNAVSPENASAAADSEEWDSADLTEEESGQELWELYPEMEMPTITIDGYRYIGILEIPSRNLKLPVMEEWDYTRLNIAPCCYSGSVYQDDMVICGHNYSGHFSEIRYIGVGETVIFTDVDGNVFNYVVDNVETLQPTQVDDMITGDWDLTLFTCNTGARTRRAVRCYRVAD